MRRHAAVRTLGAMAVMLVTLSACASAPETGDTDSASADQESGPSREVPAQVSVVATGDVELDWQANADVHIVAAVAPEQGVSIMSIGFLDLHSTGHEREHFRWAVELLGQYTGPGTYHVAATHTESTEDQSTGAGAGANGAPSGLRSTAALLHVILADGVVPHDPPYSSEEIVSSAAYERLYEDCVVEIAEGGRSGSLTCPDLRERDGGAISLQVTWQELDHDGHRTADVD